jgi:uncharacterized protein (DUF1800 family)
VDQTLRALNRFGLGARIGERRRIADPRGWLKEQLAGGPAAVAAPPAADPAATGEAVRAYRAVGKGNPRERQQARRRVMEIAAADSHVALTTRVTSDRPLIERLVAFWSNHLCVSTAAKFLVTPLAGSYERDAIRPHVLGRFEDMVLASAKHPAMLIYLDNFQSVGPDSRGAVPGGRPRPGGPRGLNENYARELLELHTLGVGGGYTQRDVQELAKILTGWTIDGLVARPAVPIDRGSRAARARTGAMSGPPQAPPAAAGTKTLLTIEHREDGEAEGERAIRDLCRHPSTALFVATKLVVHFVADEPPATAVQRVARAFRDSGGDLAVVSRSLIELPDAWRADLRKFRAPQDWVVAVLRAFGTSEVGGTLPNVLRQLRHPLWAPQAPKGFGDTMQDWADPDSLLNRAELSRTIARRLRGSVDPRQLLEVVDLPAGNPLHDLLSDTSIAVDERVALAIAGPAFQWR